MAASPNTWTRRSRRVIDSIRIAPDLNSASCAATYTGLPSATCAYSFASTRSKNAMSPFVAAVTKPRSISRMACSSAPSAVIPGSGWSLFAIDPVPLPGAVALPLERGHPVPARLLRRQRGVLRGDRLRVRAVGDREIACDAHLCRRPLRVRVEAGEEGRVQLPDRVLANERLHVRLQEDRLVGQHRFQPRRVFGGGGLEVAVHQLLDRLDVGGVVHLRRAGGGGCQHDDEREACGLVHGSDLSRGATPPWRGPRRRSSASTVRPIRATISGSASTSARAVWKFTMQARST